MLLMLMLCMHPGSGPVFASSEATSLKRGPAEAHGLQVKGIRRNALETFRAHVLQAGLLLCFVDLRRRAARDPSE